MRTTTTRRARLVRRTLTAAALCGAAIVGIHATATDASASEPGMEECVEAVDNVVNSCLGDDPGYFRKFACNWAGGVGYILCAGSEASKNIAGRLPLVM